MKFVLFIDCNKYYTKALLRIVFIVCIRYSNLRESCPKSEEHEVCAALFLCKYKASIWLYYEHYSKRVTVISVAAKVQTVRETP